MYESLDNLYRSFRWRRIELVHDVLDRVAHLRQLVERRREFLQFARLAESKLDAAEVVIHLHLKIRRDRGEGKRDELCIVFYDAERPPQRNTGQSTGTAASTKPPLVLFYEWGRYAKCPSGENVVFVRDVENVQAREKMVRRRPFTAARLQPLDDCDRIRVNTLEPAPVFDLVSPFGLRRGDGELVSLSRYLSIRDDELPDKMVEGGTQIVDVISENKAQFARRFRFDSQAADVFKSLAVEVTPETIRVRFLPGATFAVENFKVLRRPLDLRPRTL